MKFSTIFASALSLGSAIAVPMIERRAIENKTEEAVGPIKSVLATVDQLKATVHTEVETISMRTHPSDSRGCEDYVANVLRLAATITSGEIADVVPAVQASLDTIIAEIEGVVGGVGPLVLGVVGPVSEGDLQIVLEIVADVQDIVGDVQHEVEELVDVLGAGKS